MSQLVCDYSFNKSPQILHGLLGYQVDHAVFSEDNDFLSRLQVHLPPNILRDNNLVLEGSVTTLIREGFNRLTRSLSIFRPSSDSTTMRILALYVRCDVARYFIL